MAELQIRSEFRNIIRMHHSTSMYGGLDSDAYGQTAISMVGDGSSSMGTTNNTESNNCSYFNGQANVITDGGWTVAYTNGLNPMKQMEGEDHLKEAFKNHSSINFLGCEKIQKDPLGLRTCSHCRRL